MIKRSNKSELYMDEPQSFDNNREVDTYKNLLNEVQFLIQNENKKIEAPQIFSQIRKVNVHQKMLDSSSNDISVHRLDILSSSSDSGCNSKCQIKNIKNNIQKKNDYMSYKQIQQDNYFKTNKLEQSIPQNILNNKIEELRQEILTYQLEYQNNNKLQYAKICQQISKIAFGFIKNQQNFKQVFQKDIVNYYKIAQKEKLSDIINILDKFNNIIQEQSEIKSQKKEQNTQQSQQVICQNISINQNIQYNQNIIIKQKPKQQMKIFEKQTTPMRKRSLNKSPTPARYNVSNQTPIQTPKSFNQNSSNQSHLVSERSTAQDIVPPQINAQIKQISQISQVNPEIKVVGPNGIKLVKPNGKSKSREKIFEIKSNNKSRSKSRGILKTSNLITERIKVQNNINFETTPKNIKFNENTPKVNKVEQIVKQSNNFASEYIYNRSQNFNTQIIKIDTKEDIPQPEAPLQNTNQILKKLNVREINIGNSSDNLTISEIQQLYQQCKQLKNKQYIFIRFPYEHPCQDFSVQELVQKIKAACIEQNEFKEFILNFYEDLGVKN